MYVINVLSPEVYEDCHIKGSLNVPYDRLAEFVQDLPKDTELIVYCASYICPMSRRAWQLLKDKGFINVRAYEGGMAQWYSQGYPFEGPGEQDYLHDQYDQPIAHEKIATITMDELKKKLGY